MIEDSIHSGKYPLDDQQKRFANSLQVINRSDSDDSYILEICKELDELLLKRERYSYCVYGWLV